MQKKHKVIDLFCGAGGMSLGFVDSRFGNGAFESIFAIDNDQAAVATYNENFCKDDHHCVQADIETWLEQQEVPKADIVIGGPPCQGFSLLNKKREGDARRALWEPYLDIVEASGASAFLMENVPGLLKSEEFADIRARAERMGFELINPQVLNTADYGAPQTRKRAIVLALKRDHFELQSLPNFPPKKSHSNDPIGNEKLWTTVREYIGDLPPMPVGTEFRTDESYPLDLHFGRKPTDMSLERYKAVPPGGNRFDLQANRPDITPNCWIKKKSGGTDLFGRLWWERPSVTIRTEFFKPEKGRYLHPEQHRPITHREAARLMSFPDDFMFKGTKIEVARQIGNAVPPLFAGQLAKSVDIILKSRTRKTIQAA